MKLYNLDTADRYAQFNTYGVETLRPDNNCEMRSVEIHNKFGFDIQMGMVFKKCKNPEKQNVFNGWGYGQIYTYHLWNKVGDTIYDSPFQYQNHHEYKLFGDLQIGKKVGVVELPKWKAEKMTIKDVKLLNDIIKQSLRKASLKGVDIIYFANFAACGCDGNAYDGDDLKAALKNRTEQMEKYHQENLVY